MKRRVRFLLTSAFITTGLLTGAVGQRKVTSNTAAVLLATSQNAATPPASDAQAAEQTPSQPLAEQSQPWIDKYAVEGLQDLLFDLDVYQFVTAPDILQQDAQWLKLHPDVQVNLAGYADPRGDIVYNLVLANQRAQTVKQELIKMGIAEDRIVFATGWGKLYRNCLDSSEECWKRNRRVQFVYAHPVANGRISGQATNASTRYMADLFY